MVITVHLSQPPPATHFKSLPELISTPCLQRNCPFNIALSVFLHNPNGHYSTLVQALSKRSLKHWLCYECHEQNTIHQVPSRPTNSSSSSQPHHCDVIAIQKSLLAVIHKPQGN